MNFSAARFSTSANSILSGFSSGTDFFASASASLYIYARGCKSFFADSLAAFSQRLEESVQNSAVEECVVAAGGENAAQDMTVYSSELPCGDEMFTVDLSGDFVNGLPFADFTVQTFDASNDADLFFEENRSWIANVNVTVTPGRSERIASDRVERVVSFRESAPWLVGARPLYVMFNTFII